MKSDANLIYFTETTYTLNTHSTTITSISHITELLQR